MEADRMPWRKNVDLVLRAARRFGSANCECAAICFGLPHGAVVPSCRRMPQLCRRIPAPSFLGLAPASVKASRRAATASGKRDTRAELMLRRYLHARGLRFRIDVAALPGRPDIVLARSRVAVFVDGDFWHGRRLKARLVRLSTGHNPIYWTQKILANRARDRRVTAALHRLGWRVVRAWESDIQREVDHVGEKIVALVRARSVAAPQSTQAVARSRATAP